MSDDFDQKATGAGQIAVGLATLDFLKTGEGLMNVLGLETNASAVQKLVAADFEDFIFTELLTLKGESAQHNSRLDTYEQRLAKLTWIVDEFERRLGGQGANPSDLVALFDASFKVWKATADAKKRNLLGNALRNSFNAKQYEEGLTLRLLDILAGLTYGEMWMLRCLHDNAEYLKNKGALPQHGVPMTAHEIAADSLRADHVTRLKGNGLVLTWKISGRESVERHTPTELGERLLALTADPTRT